MYSFEEKARKVHGDKYDYSKVKYVNLLTKVEIICPEHGSFWQVPKNHLAGRGCPHKDCVRKKLEATNLERYGVARPLQAKEVHDRVIETNMRVYGVRNPSMAKAVSDKRIATCREKYGVDYSLQASEVTEKRKATNRLLYGGDSPFSSPDVRRKALSTIIARYGVTNVMCISSFQIASSQTNMERRGVPYASQSIDVIAKINATKRRNGTFATSKSEVKLHHILIEMFGSDDVLHNYNGDSRYPFAVDFYVKSLDCFVELNAHWTHGHYFFDKDLDGDKLVVWQEKAEYSNFYQNAVHVWTDADVRKREMARRNNLNYVVFWDNKLRDFEMWRDAGCPSSHDWEREYQWFYEREGLE